MEKIVTSLLLSAVILLVGCNTSKTVYAPFYEQRAYKMVNVSSDATMVQDKINEKKDAFVAPESEKMLDEIHDATIGILREKGYTPSQTYWKSTGLSIPSNYTAFVVNSADEDSGPDLSGPHQIDLKGRTPTKVEEYAVERLFERLLRLNLLDKETPNIELSEIADLNFPDGEYICVVSGFARNVHTGKQLAQATAVALVSLGTLVMWEPDAAIIQVAIIDPKTQRIVWANQTPAGANTKSIRKTLDTVLKDLPEFEETSSNQVAAKL